MLPKIRLIQCHRVTAYYGLIVRCCPLSWKFSKEAVFEDSTGRLFIHAETLHILCFLFSTVMVDFKVTDKVEISNVKFVQLQNIFNEQPAQIVEKRLPFFVMLYLAFRIGCRKFHIVG